MQHYLFSSSFFLITIIHNDWCTLFARQKYCIEIKASEKSIAWLFHFLFPIVLRSVITYDHHYLSHCALKCIVLIWLYTVKTNSKHYSDTFSTHIFAYKWVIIDNPMCRQFNVNYAKNIKTILGNFIVTILFQSINALKYLYDTSKFQFKGFTIITRLYNNRLKRQKKNNTFLNDNIDNCVYDFFLWNNLILFAGLIIIIEWCVDIRCCDDANGLKWKKRKWLR